MDVIKKDEQLFYVHVFGSSVLKVDPDIALVSFRITRTGRHPSEAFQEVNDVTKNVHSILSELGIDDIGSTRITLAKSYRGKYTAQVYLHLTIKNIDQVEEIITAVVDAGAYDVLSVDFQTTQLKEIRGKARRQAAEAARAKADLYCNAVGAKVGKVIHIKDLNPDKLVETERIDGKQRGIGHGMWHSESLPPIQRVGDVTPQSFDPAKIVVGAAVEMDFEIL